MMKSLFAAALAVTVLPAVAAAQNAPAAFNQCKACHKVEAGKHGVGPSLAGVYGTTAGTNWPDYKYSDRHKASGLVWDEANLTKYLADPKAVIPGNKMAFAGLKNPADVKAVIDYLKTLRR